MSAQNWVYVRKLFVLAQVFWFFVEIKLCCLIINRYLLGMFCREAPEKLIIKFFKSSLRFFSCEQQKWQPWCVCCTCPLNPLFISLVSDRNTNYGCTVEYYYCVLDVYSSSLGLIVAALVFAIRNVSSFVRNYYWARPYRMIWPSLALHGSKVDFCSACAIFGQCNRIKDVL